MKLKINKTKVDVRAGKGDVVAMKLFNGEILYYLIAENCVEGYFTLVNLSTNNIMSSIKGYDAKSVVLELARRIKGNIVEIIPSDELVLSRKHN
ncbi:hypothetical protein ACW5UC_24950 [Priestia aryabhattai]|uniref:hypothetical protein n=1 Tax=Priestia megaterium TaxID=1404 RepID=UPI003F988F67